MNFRKAMEPSTDPATMPEPREKYACDTCRSRKVACSREPSGCQRCKAENIVCSYSRSGIVRRNRKSKITSTMKGTPASTMSRGIPTRPVTERGGLRRPPGLAFEAAANATAHERLQRLMGRDHPSLGPLALALEEHSSTWQSNSAFEKLSEGASKEYFVFEETQIRPWVDAFANTLQTEQLLLTSAPPEILEYLTKSHPHQIHDRAWLVMFYTIALSTVSSAEVVDESTKAKLRSNLWLAFNDVRLLLEPSIPNIQALFMLACHAEEFMTPSICWSLISKAGMMLQALGVTHWRLDAASRDRRAAFFWRLNILDKSISLVLSRPPSLSRETASTVPMPTLEQLLATQPRRSNEVSVLFNAHYMHQMHLLSCVMADAWHCLYGQEADEVNKVKANLEAWHQEATQVLEAAALAEKPLLSPTGVATVEHGLKTLRFHYYTLVIVLTISCRELRMQAAAPARQMLQLLPDLGDMMLDLKQPYNTCLLLCYRMHCPLAAFGNLWGEVVVRAGKNFEQSKKSLEAIENLPEFLRQLGSRSPLATKLASIADNIIHHARIILHSSRDAPEKNDERTLTTSIPTPSTISEARQIREESLSQLAGNQVDMMSPAATTAMTITPGGDNLEYGLDGLFGWPDDAFVDGGFNWDSWDKVENP